MNPLNAELTNCDIEPIHIVGKIQKHGFLIAVASESLLISHISGNIPTSLPHLPKDFLGKHIDEIKKPLHLYITETLPDLSQIIKLGIANNFSVHNPIIVTIKSKSYSLVISAAGNNYLLEFEYMQRTENIDIQKIIGKSVSAILSKTTVNTLMKSAASEIKEIIGYDRVMIYKFDEEGHGQVVAEELYNTLEPFLGLHYPASDIPRQARELYKLNLTRIIADVNSECYPILTAAENIKPLDLTFSILRAVSPLHIEYLENMGVVSSFSVSLILKGELWGLIACHNYTPKFIEYKKRDASKIIGQILSSALEYRMGEEDSKVFVEFNDAVNEIIHFLDNDREFVNALTAFNINLQNINSSTGVILYFENKITSLGLTPSNEEVNEIIIWLKNHSDEKIFTSNKFSAVFPPAKKYSKFASGIMACWLSKELSEIIIWFKPEQIQTVNWAGNPEKPVEISSDGLLKLSPRKSFASWSNIVAETSEKWSRAEVATALTMREQLMFYIKRKINEVRILNERLKLAYEEIDTFNSTVSHDLTSPLTAVKSYAELLLANGENLDENAKLMLGRINICVDKMALLIKEILNYSRIGKAQTSPVTINMASLIHSIKVDLYESIPFKNTEFMVGETPNIEGDFVMIQQVFTNLISNALKYSSKVSQARVTIEGRENNNEIIYSIYDNGIGIDVKYYDSVFELFRRMDNVVGFDGSGVGLAIVKRIVLRHNARIWFESELGKSTTFYVAFQKKYH